MAKPKWITKAGNLGSFEENIMFEIILNAEPVTNSNILVYELLNGDFPESTSVLTKFTLSIDGIITCTPELVSENKKYEFTVRLKEYDQNNVLTGFADRNFNLNIFGNNIPEFVTGKSYPDNQYAPIVLDGILDSVLFEYTIEYFLNDPIKLVEFEVILGSLPDGLFMDKQGYIRGYPLIPKNNLDIDIPSKTYNFTIQMTGNNVSKIKNFSLTVINQGLLPEFMGRKPVFLNSEPLNLTLDVNDEEYPYYTDGTLTNLYQGDNFKFKLLTKSFDNNPLVYRYYSTSKLLILKTFEGSNYIQCSDTGILSNGQGVEFLEPVIGGLEANKIYYVKDIVTNKLFTISENIGGPNVTLTISGPDEFMYADLKLPPGIVIADEWLYGTFALNESSIIDTYNLSFVATDTVTGIESDPFQLKLIVTNRNAVAVTDIDIIWDTPENIGTIVGGEISNFVISAYSTTGVNLEYRIISPVVFSTSSETNNFICNNTSYIFPGQPIKFLQKYNEVQKTYDPLFGGIEIEKIYYIKEIISNTNFTISETYNGPEVSLSTGNGEILIDVLLPPNLKLLSSGDISGKLDFELSTTKSITNQIVQYKFVVEAFNIDYPEVRETKLFSINTVNKLSQPYENVYIRAFLSRKDRSKLLDIFYNIEVFTSASLYKKNDLYYGLNPKIFYTQLVGLEASTVEDYLILLDKNFYDKSLTLGEAKFAKAFNENNEVVYEVVYAELIDDLSKNNNSISKEIYWPRDLPTQVSRLLYPNSLFNMKLQISSNISSISDTSILPLWMRSIQEDGTNVGLTPNWVLCYAKPGQGAGIVERFNNKYRLNDIHFEIDRFIIDRSLTYNYSPDKKIWYNLPSSGVEDDSKDEYIYYSKNTILK